MARTAAGAAVTAGAVGAVSSVAGAVSRPAPPDGALRALRHGGSPRLRRLLTAAAAVGGLCVGLRMLARQLLINLLYHPLRYQDDPASESAWRGAAEVFGRISYQLEQIEYKLPVTGIFSADSGGLKQKAFLVHPKGPPSGGLWMIFGGNAMVGMDWLHFVWDLLGTAAAPPAAGAGAEGGGGGACASELARRPAFLLFDYPGYGANLGTPSPGSTLAGSFAALRAALPRLAGPPGELHLLGHSLGAAAAAQLAVHFFREPPRWGADAGAAAASLRPGRLVLSAAFTSIEALARALIFGRGPPQWLLRLLVAHHWDNVEWVPKAASGGWAVAMIHGWHDEIVPLSMGEALREAVRSAGYPCSFVEVKTAGHNDLIMDALHEYARLMDFPARRETLDAIASTALDAAL